MCASACDLTPPFAPSPSVSSAQKSGQGPCSESPHPHGLSVSQVGSTVSLPLHLLSLCSSRSFPLSCCLHTCLLGASALLSWNPFSIINTNDVIAVKHCIMTCVLGNVLISSLWEHHRTLTQSCGLSPTPSPPSSLPTSLPLRSSLMLPVQ